MKLMAFLLIGAALLVGVCQFAVWLADYIQNDWE